MSGVTLIFSFSKNALISSPTYGKKLFRKCSTTTSFRAPPFRNCSALATASSSRSPLDPSTTQWTSASGCSDNSRSMVPPQPISMSSLWAPTQRMRIPRSIGLVNSNVSTSDRSSRLAPERQTMTACALPPGARAVLREPQQARGTAGHDRMGRHIARHHAPGADEGVFADGDVGQDGRSRADRRSLPHQRRLDLPVLLGLQRTVRGSARIGIVDEHHAVAHEDVVLDGHALADEGVAGDLAILADPGVLLHLDEGAALGVGTHFTPVEIDEPGRLHALAQLHVARDAEIVAHIWIARPRSFSERSAASRSFTTLKPAMPSFTGV